MERKLKEYFLEIHLREFGIHYEDRIMSFNKELASKLLYERLPERMKEDGWTAYMLYTYLLTQEEASAIPQ